VFLSKFYRWKTQNPRLSDVLVAALEANVKIRLLTSVFDCSDHSATTVSKFNKNVWKIVLTVLGTQTFWTVFWVRIDFTNVWKTEVVKAEWQQWWLYSTKIATIVIHFIYSFICHLYLHVITQQTYSSTSNIAKSWTVNIHT
jgi:hypothetical protein